MKLSIAIAGVILLIVGIAIALVRLDLLDAETLRFLPVVIALAVGFALVYAVVAKKRVTTSRRKAPARKG